MLLFKQNSSQVLTIILAAGGTPVTGLTATDVDCYISKNGAAPVAYTLDGTNFAELSATNMPGLYTVDFTATETDVLGEWVSVFKDSSGGGAFDQYAAKARIQINLFDDLSGQVTTAESNLSSQVTTTESNLSSQVTTTESNLSGQITTTESNLSTDVSNSETNLSNQLTSTQTSLTSEIDANEVKIDAVNTNIGGFQSSIDDIKGSGFASAQHSLKVQSDKFDTRVPGEVAQKSQLVGGGGTENAPSGIGIWDVLGDGSVTMGDIDLSLKRMLGLTHENFAIRNQGYDAQNNLINATVRIYPSKADTENDTSPLAEYTISASYDSNNRLTDYTMVKEP